MTDAFHDTLDDVTRTRATIEQDTIEINEKLEDIRDWYPQLAETMLTIGSQAMDLTGIRGTTQRIPGGDALTMLGPWSPGYDEPDDLPHPAQIIHEWADRWRDATRTPTQPGEKWAAHLAIVQANTAWYIRMDQSGAFRHDIRALWGRLRALTGNQEREQEHHRGPEHCQERANEIPNDFRLTAKDADLFWPGIQQKLKDDRHHNRPVPERANDRTYTAGDLRDYLARRSCEQGQTVAT